MSAEPGTNLVPIPITGEVVDFDGPTTDLAQSIASVNDLMDTLAEFRRAIVEEVCRRMDSANARTERVGDWTIKTNAPTKEEVDPVVLRERLSELVEEKILDPVVLERLIVTETKIETKVKKVELNKLAKHPDGRIKAAIAEAVEEVPQKRTMRVEREGS